MGKLNFLLLLAVLFQSFALIAQGLTISRLEEYASTLRRICELKPAGIITKYDIPAWRAP